MIWVVDATDRLRIDDCRAELAGLMLEEVSLSTIFKDAMMPMSKTASHGRKPLDIRE